MINFSTQLVQMHARLLWPPGGSPARRSWSGDHLEFKSTSEVSDLIALTESVINAHFPESVTKCFTSNEAILTSVIQTYSSRFYLPDPLRRIIIYITGNIEWKVMSSLTRHPTVSPFLIEGRYLSFLFFLFFFFFFFSFFSVAV